MTDSEIIKAVYADLVRKGRVYSLREFAGALGYNRTYLSEIMNDTRGRGFGMSNELKKTLTDVFNVNPMYLSTGVGDIYNEGGVLYTPIQRSSDLLKGVDKAPETSSSELQMAKDLIESQKMMIEALREKINRLEGLISSGQQ